MARAKTLTRRQTLRTMPYKDYLLTPEWEKLKTFAILRACAACQVCNESERPLHVHHRTYERRGDELPSDLTVLCESCHALFHGKQDTKTAKPSARRCKRCGTALGEHAKKRLCLECSRNLKRYAKEVTKKYAGKPARKGRATHSRPNKQDVVLPCEARNLDSKATGGATTLRDGQTSSQTNEGTAHRSILRPARGHNYLAQRTLRRLARRKLIADLTQESVKAST